MGPQGDTIEVDEQHLQTVTIHDRVFQKHSADHNVYLVPIDEKEGQRLELQNKMFEIVFDERMIFPPVPHPKSVLDCGYGTASWSIEVAEAHPDCEVIGVDISPHLKPEDTPENFWPQLDDLNQPFTFEPNTFDLVHSRMVAGGINASRWPTYIRDIRRVLKPGGWVQMIECYYMGQSDNGSITDSHALRRWSNNYIRSVEGIKDPRAPLRLKTLFTEAGLVEVDSTMIPLPLCGWSNEPRQRRIGEVNKDNVRRLLSALAVLPFTRRLGMSIHDVNELVARASVDAANPALKPYFPLYIFQGQMMTSTWLT